MGSCYCWWWASLQSKNNNFVTSLLWPAPLCTFPFPTMPVNTRWKQSSIPSIFCQEGSLTSFFAITYSLLISVFFVDDCCQYDISKMTKKKERNWQKSPPSEQTIFRTFMLMKINVTSTIIYMKNWEASFIRILL